MSGIRTLDPVAGKNASIIWNDTDVTDFFNDVTISNSIDALAVPSFGHSAKRYTAGMIDGSLSMSGMWDGDAGDIADILSQFAGSAVEPVVSIAPSGGCDPGDRCSVMKIIMTTYDQAIPAEDMISISVDAQADDGIWNGNVLFNDTVTAAVSGPGVDVTVPTFGGFNGIDTNLGAVSNLHVISNSLDVEINVAVEMDTTIGFASPTTLFIFTSVVAGTPTAEQVIVNPGITIEQFIRAEITGAPTSGSALVIVCFARKLVGLTC